MSTSHDFRLGERVVMTYPYVGPNAHPGDVVWITPRSVRIRFDGNERPVRFLLRDKQWRSEFGYAVSIRRSKQETNPHFQRK